MKKIIVAVALLAVAYAIGDILLQDAAYSNCIGNGPSKCSPAGSSVTALICMLIAGPILIYMGFDHLDSKSSRKR